jgi:hypothetical protein
MLIMKISKEILVNNLDLPWSAIEDSVIDNSRWSIDHEIIFEYQGKFYRAYYSVGATEMQMEKPWEYEDTVECTEVAKKQVMVEQWVPVEANND